MENHKTLFQQISTAMEAALERYKNQYPKHLGQIIRHNFGKIAVCLVCFILMACLFSFSMKLGFFLMAGTPGVLIFTVLMANANKEENTEDNGDLKTIQKLKDKMASLLSYPDVQKYCEGFEAKAVEVTAQKATIQKRFRNLVIIGSVTMVTVITLLIIRGCYLSEQMRANPVAVEDDGIGFKAKIEQLQLSALCMKGWEFCRLQPLQPDGADLQLCYNEYTENQDDVHRILSVINPEVLKLDNEDYCITITYQNGTPVPRCPQFFFSGPTCQEIKSNDLDFQYIRIIKLLKDHRQELRYKIEMSQFSTIGTFFNNNG